MAGRRSSPSLGFMAFVLESILRLIACDHNGPVALPVSLTQERGGEYPFEAAAFSRTAASLSLSDRRQLAW